MNMSAGDACGDTALSAGCGSSIAITVSQPGYDMPSIPTRPLLCGTFLSSQSIVSYVSVLSSIAFGLRLVAHRAQHHELPFRREPPPDVLEDEDVAVAHQVLERGALEAPRPFRPCRTACGS